MGIALTSSSDDARGAVIGWRSLELPRHGIFEWREDPEGSQSPGNVNIPYIYPESNLDLGKVPGSLKEFLKDQRINFF